MTLQYQAVGSAVPTEAEKKAAFLSGADTG